MNYTATQQEAIDCLDQNLPAEEKYKTYILAYSPENALKHFIRKQTTPKPDGWKKMPARADGQPYSETIFAVQVKGSALAPTHEPNGWVVLNYPDGAGGDLEGRLALVQHGTIIDGY